MRPLAAVASLLALLPLALGASAAVAQQTIADITPVGPGDLQTDVGAQGNVAAGVDLRRAFSIDVPMGPFLLRPSVQLGTGVESFLRAAARDEGTDLRAEARFFVEAGPRADLFLPIAEKHLFQVGAETSYRWFIGTESRSEENLTDSYWRTRALAAYNYSGEVLSATVTADGSRDRRGTFDFLDSGVDGEIVDIDQRVGVLNLNAGARIGIRLGERTDLSFQGTRNWYEYDEDAVDLDGDSLAAELNRLTYTAGARLNRRVTTKTSVFLMADTNRTEFDSATFRDTWTSTARVGVNLNPSARLSGDADAGFRVLSPDDTRLESFTGLVSNVRVAYVAAARLRLHGNGIVETAPTAWENNAYVVNSGGGGGLDYQFTRRFRLGGFVDYRRLSYPEPVSRELDDGTLFTAKRKDDYIQYRAVFTFFATQPTPLDLTVGYYIRNSNFESESTRGFLLNLSVNAAFRKSF